MWLSHHQEYKRLESGRPRVAMTQMNAVNYQYNDTKPQIVDQYITQLIDRPEHNHYIFKPPNSVLIDRIEFSSSHSLNLVKKQKEIIPKISFEKSQNN